MSDHQASSEPAPAAEQAPQSPPSEQPQSTLERWRWVPWALAILFGVLCLVPNQSFDVWWHLSYGRQLWETGAFPVVDAFSWTYEGRPIANVPWLTGLLFFAFWSLGGAAGLVILQGLVGVAIVAMSWAYNKARGVRWHWFVLVFLFAHLLIYYRIFLLRALITPFILIPVACLLWHKGKDAPWSIWRWLLPLVMMVWANCHGSVPVACLWLGLFVGWPIVFDAEKRKAEWLESCLLIIAGGLATLVSPTGWSTWLLVFEPILEEGPRLNHTQNVEAKGLIFSNVLHFHAMWLVLVILGALAAASGSWRKHGHEVMFVLALVGLSVMQKRFTGLSALTFVLFLPGWLEHLFAQTSGGRARWLKRSVLVFIAACFVAAPFWSWWFTSKTDKALYPTRFGLEADADRLPVYGARYLRDNNPDGRLYNRYEAGGYIHWIAPSWQVSMDGRTNVLFDDDFYRSHTFRFRQKPELLPAYLTEIGARTAIVNHGAMSHALWQDPAWIQVAIDELFVVYLKRGSPKNDALIERDGYFVFHLVKRDLKIVSGQWEELRKANPEAFRLLGYELQRMLDAGHTAPFLRSCAQLYADMAQKPAGGGP